MMKEIFTILKELGETFTLPILLFYGVVAGWFLLRTIKLKNENISLQKEKLDKLKESYESQLKIKNEQLNFQKEKENHLLNLKDESLAQQKTLFEIKEEKLSSLQDELNKLLEDVKSNASENISAKINSLKSKISNDSNELYINFQFLQHELTTFIVALRGTNSRIKKFIDSGKILEEKPLVYTRNYTSLNESALQQMLVTLDIYFYSFVDDYNNRTYIEEEYLNVIISQCLLMNKLIFDDNEVRVEHSEPKNEFIINCDKRQIVAGVSCLLKLLLRTHLTKESKFKVSIFEDKENLICNFQATKCYTPFYSHSNDDNQEEFLKDSLRGDNQILLSVARRLFSNNKSAFAFNSIQQEENSYYNEIKIIMNNKAENKA